MHIHSYQHRAGLNCETTCMRNVLAVHGVEFSEEVLLGLDGGFGFGYFERRDNGPDIVIGRQQIFSGQALRLLGVRARSFQGSGAAILLDQMKLERPVIARVDLSELPYWNSHGGAPFGGYFINLVGHADGQFTVSDSGFSQLQTISEDALNRARTSKRSPPINPERWCHVIESVCGTPDLGRVGYFAVENCVRDVLKPSIGNLGLPGLKQFAAGVRNWSRTKTGTVKMQLWTDGGVHDVSALACQLQSLGRAIEVFGTGGGLFRPMWSRFLHTFGDLVGDERLLDAAQAMSSSAHLWTMLGRNLLEVGPDSGQATLEQQLEALIDAIDRIYQLERKAMDGLRSIRPLATRVPLAAAHLNTTSNFA
ncbi:DUF4872 domain-containing protein [Massilia sp. CCM 8733]|uniref:DUF4872 domain-containing protein n=1 Tax=Massilia mucilaginosa TaxID=2609282 RepID=A0ABX0P0M4_9BURK|nr:DUF4872 domain-containing protein [Massilia mucilaginosa]NHZ92755.1 DUF4872 domain-containing protein [Massilia mucilaginosa]